MDEPIIEYRNNGFVTLTNDNKYIFHALSDIEFKTWRIAFKKDITEQFIK